MRRWSVAFGLALALGACGEARRSASLDAQPGAAGAPSSVPDGQDGEGGEGGDGGTPQELPGCDVPHPGAAPLSMLTNDELRRSLQDLVGAAEHASQLPAEDDARTLSRAFVEAVYSIASATAEAIVRDNARLSLILDCEPADAAEACQAHFIERFLRRAFRRPPTADDLAEMGDVFRRGQELGGSFESGVRAVIEVTLQSPEFLYLLEWGSGSANQGVVSLTPFEVAARLSYFLTGGPPDAKLAASAEQGRLLEPSGLSEEFRRLVGSPTNREHVVDFYRRIYQLDGSVDSPLPVELLAAAQTETRLFIEDATFGIGTFRALLTEPSTWLNEPLARFYGYPNVTGEDFRKVALDGRQRAGLFTQQGFLDATSFGERPGTIRRGYFVLNELLCVGASPAPTPTIPAVPPDTTGATWRERLTAATSAPGCSGCHESLNAAGFAFEHYDGAGRYRTFDGGLPIDASGVLPVTDAAGPFRDATELLQHIAASNDGQACFVRHWAELAFRRPLDTDDACLMEELKRDFQRSDGNVVQLLLRIADSDRFKYRLASELSP